VAGESGIEQGAIPSEYYLLNGKNARILAWKNPKQALKLIECCYRRTPQERSLIGNGSLLDSVTLIAWLAVNQTSSEAGGEPWAVTTTDDAC
jgi:hypothetical protein